MSCNMEDGTVAICDHINSDHLNEDKMTCSEVCSNTKEVGNTTYTNSNENIKNLSQYQLNYLLPLNQKENYNNRIHSDHNIKSASSPKGQSILTTNSFCNSISAVNSNSVSSSNIGYDSCNPNFVSSSHSVHVTNSTSIFTSPKVKNYGLNKNGLASPNLIAEGSLNGSPKLNRPKPIDELDHCKLVNDAYTSDSDCEDDEISETQNNREDFLDEKVSYTRSRSNTVVKVKVNFPTESKYKRLSPKRSLKFDETILLGEIKKIPNQSDLTKCNELDRKNDISQLWRDMDRIKNLLSKFEPNKINNIPNNQKTRIKINIGGVQHETYRSTLKNIPDTRLSWIAEDSAIHSPEYDPINREFFFDRHPQVFSHILNYYRTGNLHVPYDVCGPLYEEELQYWGIEDSQVESCCWLSYRQHRDAQETLKEFEGIEFQRDYEDDGDDEEPDLARYGFNVDVPAPVEENVTWYQKFQPVMWSFLEDPYSSKQAKIFAIASMSLITLSLFIFCMETMENFQGCDEKAVLKCIEGICVLFFIVELSLRFLFCPDKRLFIKSIMNWIDFLAIIPFFLQLITYFKCDDNASKTGYNPINIIRIIRVFRIIKLSKHSVGLQILGHTLKASFRELILLIFFLAFGIVIFSTLIYYCEKDENGTKFGSIPHTFWWAVITMTTVGYGDMVPQTWPGKLIGALCAVSGVLMIALPVPVIVNNFNLYYSHAQARLKLPKKKRRMLVGASNALKGPALESFVARDRRGSSCESISQIEDSVQNSKKSITEMDNKNENKDNDLAALRVKKFARRHSKIFDASPPMGELALTKRRSLMPSLPIMTENESS